MPSDEVQDGVVLERGPWKLHRGMASGTQAAPPLPSTGEHSDVPSYARSQGI